MERAFAKRVALGQQIDWNPINDASLEKVKVRIFFNLIGGRAVRGQFSQERPIDASVFQTIPKLPELD